MFIHIHAKAYIDKDLTNYLRVFFRDPTSIKLHVFVNQHFLLSIHITLQYNDIPTTL